MEKKMHLPRPQIPRPYTKRFAIAELIFGIMGVGAFLTAIFLLACTHTCQKVAGPPARANMRAVVGALETAWLQEAHACVEAAIDAATLKPCKDALGPGKDALVAADGQLDDWKGGQDQEHGVACLISEARLSVLHGADLIGKMPDSVTDALAVALPYVTACSAQ